MSNTIKLLQLLENDSTLKPDQLAAMTGMTEETVKAAIHDLEERKIILGYQAMVDWDKTEREAVTALIEVKVVLVNQEGEHFVDETMDRYTISGAMLEQTGIPAETLKATVEAYNGMCTTYSDPDFGRTTFEEGSQLLTGPYFAYPCRPATHITIGGVLVDDFGRVLTEEGEVIPGLYAAGEVTVANCGIDGSFAYGKFVGKVVADRLDLEQ